MTWHIADCMKCLLSGKRQEEVWSRGKCVVFADFFSVDKMFYNNKSNDWLDAPNAALFGLKGNKPQNNTVSRWLERPLLCFLLCSDNML